MDSREIEPISSRPSLRQPVSPAHPDCLLTMGSQCLAAILSEEWDTVLHVLIQGSPMFWVEDTGMLQTPEAEIPVRVSNIVRMESDEDDLGSSVPAFRIGLSRLPQSPMKSPSAPNPTRGPRAKRSWLPPLKRIRLSVGGLIAFALIATPLLLVALAWRNHIQPANSVNAQNPLAVATDLPACSPTIPQQSAATTVPEPTPEILQLPGIEPFLKREVARKLALTPSQTGAFRRLNKTTQAALEDLEKYWEHSSPSELARRRSVLQEVARQEALELLTERQRQQWDAITH